MSTAIVRTEREQWLAQRKTAVGASEVAAILGEDPRRGQLAIYIDKVSDKPSEDDEDWMAYGRDIEVALAKGYQRKSGRVVIHTPTYEFVRCPDLPCLGATPDSRLEGGSVEFPAPAVGPGTLELKEVGFQKKHEWASEPPMPFVIQVQTQLACTGLLWGSLGGRLGLQFADPVDFVPNKDFINAMKEAVAEFWWHVETKTPPPADGKPQTYDAIKRLWARDKGLTIPLDHEALKIVTRWEARNALRHRADEMYKEEVNHLAMLMGDAAFGLLPDGSTFAFKTEDVAAQCCKACNEPVKKSFIRRVPRRTWPKALKGGKSK